MEMEIRFPGGKKVEATFDTLRVLTDQPVEDGGEGSAPSPFDLFLTSLGTCIGYYVMSFCQKNNIPTDKIRLTASFDWNTQKHLVENVDIKIHLPADFPTKYKTAVVKAADVCTVKRHLQNPPIINIELAHQ